MLRILNACLLILSPLLLPPAAVQAQSRQDLANAIDRGNVAEVVRLVDADPSSLNKKLAGKNETPLARAISRGKPSVVKALLDRNATVGENPNGRSAIMLAITRRNADVVSALLQHGGDWNGADRNQETPLMYAVRYDGPPEWIKSMVQGGAELNAVNRARQTALHMACYYKRPQLAEALLAAGARSEAVDNAGNTPLMAACLSSPEFAITLLEKGAKLDVVNGQNQVPLHLVAQAGHSKLMNKILATQPTLDAIDQRGMTPLAYAVRNRRAEIAIELLKRGANPNLMPPGRGMLPPICQAALNLQANLVAALLKAGADANATDASGNTPLHHAVFGTVDSVGGLPGRPVSNPSPGQDPKPLKTLTQALLKAGANANLKNKEGLTPFQLAASTEKLTAVELLAESTSDLSLTTKTPVEHWIANRGTINFARQLAKRGEFDFQRTNQSGQTPLGIAASQGHQPLVQFLIPQSRALLEQPDLSGMTPLLAAVSQGYADVASQLIEAGADPAAKDQTGQTALHLATWSGDLPTFKRMIDAGLDPTAATATGYTPIHAAAWQGNLDMARGLLAQGADINAADSDGWTPLHKAAHQGHVEMTKWLLAQGADRDATNVVGMKPRELAKQPSELGFD